MIHPDGTGDRVFHRLAGSSSQESPAASTSRQSPPRFSPDSRSLLWLETLPASASAPVNWNMSRVMVQSLTDPAPKEVTRVADRKNLVASVVWSPDSRSVVLHLQEGSRHASDARFEVYDLNGKLIQTVNPKSVPDAGTRMISYLIDCR